MAYQQDKGTQNDLSHVNLLTLTAGVLFAKKILLFCSYSFKVVLTIMALLTENA